MSSPKIMVLCADPGDRSHVVRRLEEVLMDASTEDFAQPESVEEARKVFSEAPWRFVLLVVDVHAPLEVSQKGTREPKTAESLGEGGYVFVEEHVLTSGYPPPPILLISRFGDFKDERKQAWGLRVDPAKTSQLDVAQIELANFTSQELDRNFRELGLSTQPLQPPFTAQELQRGAGPAQKSLDQYVGEQLGKCLLEIYRQEDRDDNVLPAWDVVRRIDDTFMRPAIRERVLADEAIIRRIDEWYHRLQIILESKGHLSPQNESTTPEGRDTRYRDYSWFHLLRAELTWNLHPVASLYCLIKAMKLNIEANAEPLGGPGDPADSVTLRLNADQQRSRIPARIAHSIGTLARHLWPIGSRARGLAQGKPKKPLDSAYKEKTWHAVLRFQVSKAAKDLKGSPEALLDLENRLANLSRTLQDKGRARSAHELEARSCEVRKERLNQPEKSLYGILYRLCDFGNQPFRLFGWCVLSVMFCALLYLPTPSWLAWIPTGPFAIHFKSWPYIPTMGLGSWALLWAWVNNCITAVYFSVVTFVTLGYGDITPDNPFGKIIAMFEAGWGFTMFGLFIAVASSRLRPR